MAGFIFLSANLLQAKTYILKKGDTLANVARGYYGEPVFGPKGSIKKIYKLNPWTKAKNLILEPGQELILEDKEAAHEKDDNVKVAAPAVVIPPPAQHIESVPVPAQPVAKVEKEHLESAKATASPDSELHEAPAKETHQETHPEQKHQMAHESAHTEHQAHSEHGEETHNYWSIIPSYSQVTQAATEVASGKGYSLSGVTTLGVELGWDHWWNSSLSTILTMNISQMSSTSANNTATSGQLGPSTTIQYELAVLNRVAPSLRFGLGFAYGDHLFLENFADVPANPSLYKVAFWNPFLAAEYTAYESERYECLLSAKMAALPAQVGHGHDLTSGTEFFVEASFLQKFEKRAVTYGLSYSTEDQTRTDANETRSELALKIGVLF